jgi:hypothetical protein
VCSVFFSWGWGWVWLGGGDGGAEAVLNVGRDIVGRDDSGAGAGAGVGAGAGAGAGVGAGRMEVKRNHGRTGGGLAMVFVCSLEMLKILKRS